MKTDRTGGGDVHTEFWWGNMREELLGRTRHRWEDDTNADLQEMGWNRYIKWIVLAEDRNKWWAVVSTSMNIWVSKSLGKSLTK
jgi:hypothetical protein